MAIKELNLEGGTIQKNPKKKYIKIALPIIGLLILFVAGFIAYAGFVVVPNTKNFTTNVQGAYDQAEKVQAAIKSEDVLKTKEETIKLKEELKTAQKDLDNLGFVRFIPVANGYYNDSKHIIAAGVVAAEAGELAADGILPFADVLGLEGHKSKVTAKEKSSIIVKEVLPTLSPLVDKLEEKLNRIDKELSQVDPNRYPEGLIIKGFKVKSGLIQAKEGVNKAQEILPDAKVLLSVAPEVLGQPKEKTYLILFQNDKELRGTGGFITSYAIARVKSGKLVSIKSEDIYNLDKRFTPIEPPPEVLQKYLLLKIFPIRDANLSPDFATSAQKFESFYKTIPGLPEVDGIISIDTEFVSSLLEFTGPIKLEKIGETFSAEKNEYGVSDFFYKMELYAQQIFRGSSERKSFIGDLMNEIIDRVLKAPPEKFESLTQIFVKDVEEKHIQFYFKNKTAQEFVRKFDAAGEIKNYEGDYLHVNNSNFAGLKANAFIDYKIEQDIVTSKDGTVTKKVGITLTNTSNKLVGWLNSNYRNWMRVYVPQGSKIINKEVQADFKESKDLDKTVFEGFSITSPLTSSKSTFSYELPFKVKPGQDYKMLIQKQAGTISTKMIIRLNGKVIENFNLTKDKEIKFKI